MINALYGSVTSVKENAVTLLTRSGIEFILDISSASAEYYLSLTEEEKRNVKIYTILQHREDAMSLFGFKDERERVVFNELTTVPGIGPKGALKILSGISVDDLIFALDQNDVKKLSKVPGIGNKTAQKLILQLRNILVLESEDKEKEAKPTSNNRAKERFADLITSFTSMGYDRKAVTDAVELALEENKELFSDSSDDRKLEGILFPLVFRRING